MGGLTEKSIFCGFTVKMKLNRIFFTKPNSFSLMLPLLSDYIQGITIEKDFKILLKLIFLNILSHCKRKRLNQNRIKTFN